MNEFVNIVNKILVYDSHQNIKESSYESNLRLQKKARGILWKTHSLVRGEKPTALQPKDYKFPQTIPNC